MMLTIIGTGHVFNIGDSVTFITSHCWPDAVCLELDDLRYHALRADREAVEKALRERGIDPEKAAAAPKNESRVLRNNRKYQEKIAKENGVNPAADMVAAIGVALSLKAEIFCVDNDVRKTMDRMWSEMGTMEKLRYRFSGVLDRFGGKKRADQTQADYYDDEGRYLEEFRKKYPAMTRVLIDERNEVMAKRITDVARTHERVVAVVGDGHVNGLLALIPDDIEKRVVRLRDLTDPDRINELKRKYWEMEE